MMDNEDPTMSFEEDQNWRSVVSSKKVTIRRVADLHCGKIVSVQFEIVHLKFGRAIPIHFIK